MKLVYFFFFFLVTFIMLHVRCTRAILAIFILVCRNCDEKFRNYKLHFIV